MFSHKLNCIYGLNTKSTTHSWVIVQTLSASVVTCHQTARPDNLSDCPCKEKKGKTNRVLVNKQIRKSEPAYAFI